MTTFTPLLVCLWLVVAVVIAQAEDGNSGSSSTVRSKARHLFPVTTSCVCITGQIVGRDEDNYCKWEECPSPNDGDDVSVFV
mmetsp:Transcript_23074/g.34067  ORF Transcript_23074/g.34067 Transcript_23074/m.34067 type:complete len:82 (+) Transcript_23074:310-555(+)